MSDIQLTSTSERYVQQALDSGRYADASEVVEDALRLHALDADFEARKLAALKAKVDAGLKSAEEGRVRRYESFDDFLGAIRRRDSV